MAHPLLRSAALRSVDHCLPHHPESRRPHFRLLRRPAVGKVEGTGARRVVRRRRAGIIAGICIPQILAVRKCLLVSLEREPVKLQFQIAKPVCAIRI